MATLGRPAIPSPRQLDLTAVAGAISAARQRIEALEQQLGLVTAQSGQSTLIAGQSNASISNLQSQIAVLRSRVDALAADTELETFRADTAIDENTAVYPSSDGGVSQVSPGDPVAVYAVLGVATHVASAGANVQVRKSGVMQIANAVFEDGGPIYVGADGLTQFPDYLNLAIPVGVAVSTDEIDVHPGWPALQYPGPYSEHETFLPATWGLVRDAVTLAEDFNAASNGIVVRTGVDGIMTRTLIGGTGITITDGDGVGGNPSVAIDPLTLFDDPTATIGFVAVPGVATTAQRSDAAPVLGNVLVTAGADSFSLSTADDPGGTTDRGDITFNCGENDTFTGSQFAMTGAGVAGSGNIDFTAGGRMALSARGGENVLHLGEDTVTLVQLTAVDDVLVQAGGDLDLTTGAALRLNGKPVVLGGALTTSGAFASTFTMTGTTTVTFPTSGTLATTAQLPVGANPSASVGLSAVNGSAATFMRSDGAPALSQAIAPTWTGNHTFAPSSGNTLFSAGRVGIETTAPTAPLQVGNGTAGIVGRDLVLISGTVTPSGTSGFQLNVSNGTINAAPNTNANIIFANGTLVPAASGTHPLFASMRFIAPTITSGGGAPISEATTLYLQGAPTSGVVNYALHVTSGTCAFGGSVNIDVDSAELRLGAGNDLRLYHDGTDSQIENDTGNLLIKSGGDLLLSEGQVALQTVGKGLSIKEGTNAKQGAATLVAGTVVVNTTAVTANSRIQLTPQNLGTVAVPAPVGVSARTAGTSFTILSASAIDTSLVAWTIFEPS